MILIKQFEKKWRLKIENEEWEFKSLKELKKILGELLNYKEKNGQIYYNGET